MWVIYDFLKVIKFVDYTIDNALLTIITILYDVEETRVYMELTYRILYTDLKCVLNHPRRLISCWLHVSFIDSL